MSMITRFTPASQTSLASRLTCTCTENMSCIFQVSCSDSHHWHALHVSHAHAQRICHVFSGIVFRSPHVSHAHVMRCALHTFTTQLIHPCFATLMLIFIYIAHAHLACASHAHLGCALGSSHIRRAVHSGSTSHTHVAWSTAPLTPLMQSSAHIMHTERATHVLTLTEVIDVHIHRHRVCRTCRASHAVLHICRAAHIDEPTYSPHMCFASHLSCQTHMQFSSRVIPRMYCHASHKT